MRTLSKYCAMLLMCAIFFTACNSATSDNSIVEASSSEISNVQIEENVVQEQYVSPIDFVQLQEQNPEIYAWIRIPDTTVDYPILQSMESDEYYLRRDVNRQDSLEGSLFTQVTYNSQSFNDGNTVIYGHNMLGYGDTMFTDVRKYSDVDYFNSHKDIYIYTPDKELHYKVFAAYVWNDEHLLYTYNCRTQEGLQNYVNMVLQNKDLSANIDNTLNVNGDSKIITLSTCESNETEERFLVQAVLQ